MIPYIAYTKPGRKGNIIQEVTTNTFFDSLKAAATYYQIDSGTISKAISDNRITRKGLYFTKVDMQEAIKIKNYLVINDNRYEIIDEKKAKEYGKTE